MSYYGGGYGGETPLGRGGYGGGSYGGGSYGGGSYGGGSYGGGSYGGGSYMNQGSQYCRLSQETINFATEMGVKGPNFEKAIKTMDSSDPRDVVVHRGLETYLMKEFGHKSRTYRENCEVLHGMDGAKNWK